MKLYDNYLSSGASTPLTATASSGSPNQYPDANSYISPLLMTDVMMEIANAITTAGLSLDGTDRTQLAEAIPLLASSGSAWIRKNSAYTAVAGENILCICESNSFNLTLPATPNDGDIVKVMKSDYSNGSSAVSVQENGETIMNLSEEYVIASNNVIVTFLFDGTSNTWRAAVGG